MDASLLGHHVSLVKIALTHTFSSNLLPKHKYNALTHKQQNTLGNVSVQLIEKSTFLLAFI